MQTLADMSIAMRWAIGLAVAALLAGAVWINTARGQRTGQVQPETPGKPAIDAPSSARTELATFALG